jgi:hypothetical protein
MAPLPLRLEELAFSIEPLLAKELPEVFFDFGCSAVLGEKFLEVAAALGR